MAAPLIEPLRGDTCATETDVLLAQAMLEVPLHRLHDKSPYVRCRALHCLVQLCEAKAMPPTAFTAVATLGLARLDDKAANVRRSSLQLFRCLLEFNPFCPVLNRPALEAQRTPLRRLHKHPFCNGRLLA